MKVIKPTASAIATITIWLAFDASAGARPLEPQGLLSRVDAVFETWDRSDSPGCALGIIRAGSLLHQRGYGVANLDYGNPIGADTVFYVGSVSKQFTAAAAAMLAHEGKLQLDDSLVKHFPEFRDQRSKVTISHLIHHTSGLPDIYRLMARSNLRLENLFSDEEALQLIVGEGALEFQPGERYRYSNAGYFLLSELVERVSGHSLRRYAEESFFSRLGMESSHFHDDPGQVVPRRAISYARGEDGFRISYLANFNKVGAGGLYTTVRDLAKWDGLFYTHEVGGRKFINQLHQRGRLNDGTQLDYAFGLRIGEYKGRKTVGHNGSMMGFKASFLRFPEERLTFVCLCNLGDIEPAQLTRKVADIYLEED